MENSKIAIICAMNVELQAMLSLTSEVIVNKIGNIIIYEGKIKQKNVILATSGIGKVNASITTAIIINKYNPDYIINCGVAGGYAKELNVLDVIIAEKACYYDFDTTFGSNGQLFGQVPGAPRFFPTSHKGIEILKNNNFNFKYQIGTIISADQFATNRSFLENIIDTNFKDDNVLAVDMESAAIAHTAYNFNKDVIIVRSISDVVGVDQEHTYENFLERACNNASEIVACLLENYKV